MRIARLLAICSALALLVAATASSAGASPRPNVAALQAALEHTGHYTGEVDGEVGPLTRRAMVRFQRSAGLEVNGAFSAAMRKALGWRGRPPLGSRVMVSGHRGWDVAGLQYLLQYAGYGPGRVDGIFGSMTEQAVETAWLALGRDARSHAPRGLLRALMNDQAPQLVAVRNQGSDRFGWPVSGPIGDRFGAPRGGGRLHAGLDFPVPTGTPVAASAAGTVIFAGWNSGGYGNLVVVQHPEGYTTWYAHLSSISVRDGQRVRREQRLGGVGSTGYSTGPHLHFEIRRYDTALNPLRFLLDGSTLHSAVLYSQGDEHGHSGGDRCHGEHQEGSDQSRASSSRGNWIASEPLCPSRR